MKKIYIGIYIMTKLALKDRTFIHNCHFLNMVFNCHRGRPGEAALAQGLAGLVGVNAVVAWALWLHWWVGGSVGGVL